MKKIITILVFVIFVLQTGGILLVLQCQQLLNSINISQLLEEDNANLSEIQISKTDFEKSKIADDEFYYKNDLYDIKTIIIKGSDYKIIAIRDGEETNILKRFKKIFDESKNQRNKKPDSFVKLLSLVFVLPKSNAVVFYKIAKENIYSTTTENTVNKERSVATPPPLYS